MAATARPLVLGHRGASAYAPENTLAAFRLALAQGADGVELDVTLSADGVPVVIHDDTLDRTTTGAGPVGARFLRELDELSAGFPARFGPQFAAERIPTLAEVFEAVGQQAALINVELKVDRSPGRRLAQQVIEVIRVHGLAERVLISSFQLSNLRRVQRLAPRLPLGLLYDNRRQAPRLEQRLGCALQVAAHHPSQAGLGSDDVAWYHAHGYRVNTWTVNDEPRLRDLITAGVDGLISDRPDVAVRIRAQAASPA